MLHYFHPRYDICWIRQQEIPWIPMWRSWDPSSAWVVTHNCLVVAKHDFGLCFTKPNLPYSLRKIVWKKDTSCLWNVSEKNTGAEDMKTLSGSVWKPSSESCRRVQVLVCFLLLYLTRIFNVKLVQTCQVVRCSYFIDILRTSQNYCTQVEGITLEMLPSTTMIKHVVFGLVVCACTYVRLIVFIWYAYFLGQGLSNHITDDHLVTLTRWPQMTSC